MRKLSKIHLLPCDIFIKIKWQQVIFYVSYRLLKNLCLMDNWCFTGTSESRLGLIQCYYGWCFIRGS
ncbi:hypothetical protein HanHA300_Chr10g0345481 [Helianthus annuus]|nr:hypothetical protein HanHA300_Chr10g0345481 [Helianthus annuus]KAJ0528472.1 hypothetical protein HanHA89_Chr10g0366791 [Helianthus annuus]